MSEKKEAQTVVDKPLVAAACEYAKSGAVPEYIGSGPRPEKEKIRIAAFLAGASWREKQTAPTAYQRSAHQTAQLIVDDYLKGGRQDLLVDAIEEALILAALAPAAIDVKAKARELYEALDLRGGVAMVIIEKALSDVARPATELIGDTARAFTNGPSTVITSSPVGTENGTTPKERLEQEVAPLIDALLACDRYFKSVTGENRAHAGLSMKTAAYLTDKALTGLEKP